VHVNERSSVKARNHAVLESLQCASKPAPLTLNAERVSVVDMFSMIGPISGVKFRVVNPDKLVRVLHLRVSKQDLCSVLEMLAVKLELAYALSPKDGVIEATVGTNKAEVDLGPLQSSS
jgi:hypothetical protein